MSRNELIEALKENFSIKELVCKEVWNKFKEDAWQFISTELLSTLYTLRYEVLKQPIVINTWARGGGFTQRGLRCNRCYLVRSKSSAYLSAHIQGKAIDFHVTNMSIETAKELIRSNINKFEYPIRLEKNTDTWVHVDCYQPSGQEKKLIEFYG